MADRTTGTVNQQKQETRTKQKNPLRVEQGKRLVEYNHHKKQELKNLNEQITKQDNMTEHKSEEPSNYNYLYISGVSVVGLAIIGYLLYNRYISSYKHLTLTGIIYNASRLLNENIKKIENYSKLPSTIEQIWR